MINYYLLTKPGIILGNLLTVAAGFLLASKGDVHVGLLLVALVGLGLIIASACVFNNYIDRGIDQKMKRTRKRALVLGLISGQNALIFGTLLGTMGFSVLLIGAHLLAALVASIGFFVYVFLYSLWKSRTVYGTAIGSIAGATPPLVGYCTVSHQIDAGAAILFAMMLLWQMPHFYAIAMQQLKDYATAEIPLLPLKKGLSRTKIHMTLYIAGFILAATMLTIFGYTGQVYCFSILLLGLVWLGLCLQGFTSANNSLWARRMFQWSLVTILVVCLLISLDPLFT